MTTGSPPPPPLWIFAGIAIALWAVSRASDRLDAATADLRECQTLLARSADWIEDRGGDFYEEIEEI